MSFGRASHITRVIGVRSKRMVGVTLRLWLTLLSLVSNDFSESTQCLIHCLGIWKYLGDVGIENNYIRALRKSVYILPAYPITEIILIQHVWIRFVISVLIHILFSQSAWRRVH